MLTLSGGHHVEKLTSPLFNLFLRRSICSQRHVLTERAESGCKSWQDDLWCWCLKASFHLCWLRWRIQVKITALCSFSAGELCGNFNCESCHWNLAQKLDILDPNLVENEWNNFAKWVILQRRNGQPISYKISTSDNSNHQKGINFCLYSFCNLQRFNGPLLLWGYFLDSKSDRLWGGNDCPQVLHVYLSRIPLLWLCMLCMQLFDWGLKFCIGMITSEAERHSCQLTELSAVERANVESDDKAAQSFSRCLSFWARLYVTECMRISAE